MSEHLKSPKRIVLLGATGSIGRQTLDVVRMHSDDFVIVGMSANKNVDALCAYAQEFKVSHLVLCDASCRSSAALARCQAHLDFGSNAIRQLITMDDCDLVVNAISGAAGLRASYDTLACGRVLALANKESLVVGGDLIMPLATHETLLPIDSEHSAIYQCYLGEYASEARRILLTCSGGPFFGMTRSELATVTCKQALAHPTWSMGKKITIDSATLMNKGLEVIEAHHLFNMPIDDIVVLIHPQSVVHSMLEYVDGSVKAHLGVPDMRIPIQFALSAPHRMPSLAREIDFTELAPLEFFAPDLETFRCLYLAGAAARSAGTAPCIMNAANEVAVAAFLSGQIKAITHIDACVEDALNFFDVEQVQSLEQLEELDSLVRAHAQAFLETC